MAIAVNETYCLKQAGTYPALTLLVGTADADSGTTFSIIPGDNDVNIDGSAGLRKIAAWVFTCTSGEEAVKAVKSYSAAQDGEILTCTVQSGATYDWWILAEDAGA